MEYPLVESCRKILERARSILLIDWPDHRVPCSLLKAELIVYGFSPDHNSIGRLETGGSQNSASMNPVFTKINKPPDPIDIVYIFAMAKEYGITFIEGVDITEIV